MHPLLASAAAPSHVCVGRSCGRGALLAPALLRLGQPHSATGTGALRPAPRRVRATAGEGADEAPQPDGASSAVDEVAEFREDDVLPDSLEDSISQAATACAEAIRAGCTRCIVEILVPEFWDPVSGAVFKDEGDQQRWWRLTRRFLDDLLQEMPGRRARVLYPDMGVAAMLANEWQDRVFDVSAMTDRRAVQEDDDLIFLAAPDPPTLDDCRRSERDAGPTRPVVMFNPRLTSGDVGAGLSMRRLREQFLGPFQVVYSICPVGDVGSVFRRYGQPWKVFVEDTETPGRYRLAAQRDTRPSGEDLDRIVTEALGMAPTAEEEGGAGGIAVALASAMREMQRFMRQIQGV